MSDRYEIPLNLCQILEEEFENLHGSLDDGEDSNKVVMDDGSKITVERDWRFHDGHVFPARLADGLRNAERAWLQTHDKGPSAEELRAETDLATYLAFEYKGLLPALDEDKEDEGTRHVGILNDILADADEKVFLKGRFEGLSLRDETRGLMEVGWSGDRPEFSDDGGVNSDLTRFRRLLLEDAFPEEIRRIYDLRAGRVIRKVHGMEPGRSAICLSGGGIRSGTFALGVIQSLAEHGLLDKLDYLSTVSGGGYIGGWLTAWIHRHQAGLDGVIADLKGKTRDTKLEPEPRPLRHLREFSSFITPRTGLLSADTWTFVVIYIRNLLLNWVVLVPLAASVLMIPRVAVAVVLAPPGWTVLAGLLLFGSASVLLLKPNLRLALWLFVADLILLGVIFFSSQHLPGRLFARFLALAPFALTRLLSPLARVPWNAQSALLIAGTLLAGYALAYMRLNRPSNSGALRPGSYWARHRDQNSFLWWCLLPLSAAASMLTIFWAWHREVDVISPGWEFLCFLIYGAVTALIACLLYALFASSTWWNSKDKVASAAREGWGLRAKISALESGLKLAGGEPEETRQKLEGDLKEAREKFDDLKRQGREIGRKVAWNAVREIAVTLSASLLGALLLWVAATKIDLFGHPLAGSFARYPMTVPGLDTHSAGGDGVTKLLAYPVSEVLRPYYAWYQAE